MHAYTYVSTYIFHSSLWRRIRLLTSQIKAHQTNTRKRTSSSAADDTQQTSEQRHRVIDRENAQTENIVLSPEFVNMQTTAEYDQYEKPSTYVNMIDRPNEYQSLNDN